MDTLATHDIEQITADNPGPYTLRGTNTWLVGRDPCWIVDPGPLHEGPARRVARAAALKYFFNARQTRGNVAAH